MIGATTGPLPDAVSIASKEDGCMTTAGRAATAGAVGALATTRLHEFTRRLLPDAPCVDLLGMQPLAQGLQAAGLAVPGGRPLYALTLAGDLVANTAYFGLVGARPGTENVPGSVVGTTRPG
jgi:hypothetical protein